MELFSKPFFTGINYWASKNSIHMWHDFDEASIDNDLAKLASTGITHLRVFPLWSDFQPLHGALSIDGVYEYRFHDSPLPDTPAGRAGVSEEACGYFDIFCALCQKHGLKLVVGLITGQMSFGVFVPPAFEARSYLTDPTVMKWQVRFVKYFVSRFRSKEVILGWDLGNEATTLIPNENFNGDSFYVWCSFIADAIRCCDPSRPVVSGFDNSGIAASPANLKTVGEYCEVHTTHPYNIFATPSQPLCSPAPILDLSMKCRLGEDISGIPTFVQEFGSIGYETCSLKSEANFYRASLLSSFTHGCHGTMWWCAFDQGHLSFPPYDWNNIGSDYGFFDKNGKEKPLVAVNRSFADMLNTVGALPKHDTQAVVLIPRDDGDADINILRSSFLLAKRAGFDVSFSYALDPIPDAPLYIFPSLSNHKSIPKRRLDELLVKIENGSSLYISIGTSLFRRFPELFGMTVSQRMVENRQREITFNGEVLPLISETTLLPEDVSQCEILASDNEGLPMFIRHAYGKGYIYLLLAPLEKNLHQRTTAFYDASEPKFDMIYRCLAKNAGLKRLCISNSPFVLATQHIIDETSAYISVINYSNAIATAELSMPEGVTLSPVYGNVPENGHIKLDACDGSIFMMENIRI